jgi:hypothetical protein
MPFLALLDLNPDPPTVSNTKKNFTKRSSIHADGSGKDPDLFLRFFIWVLAKVWVVNKVVNG